MSVHWLLVSCHPALKCPTMQVLHPLLFIPMRAASPGCRRASLWPQTGLWHATAAHARPDAARRFPRRSAALQRPAWQWTHGASREWAHGLRPTGSRPQRIACRCLAPAALIAWLWGFQHPSCGATLSSKPLTGALAVLPLQGCLHSYWTASWCACSPEAVCSCQPELPEARCALVMGLKAVRPAAQLQAVYSLPAVGFADQP